MNGIENNVTELGSTANESIRPLALVVSGDGINCENESKFACELAGFRAQEVHISRLLAGPELLSECSLLVLPGGFSFGDEIASGRVVALKLMERLEEQLLSYIASGRLLIGICNGFQALVQMGVLPDTTPEKSRSVSLVRNSGGHFINRWVTLEVPRTSKSRFFHGLEKIELPIRHGEGRLIARQGSEKMADEHCSLRYLEDINGSLSRIAGLTNEKDNVLGLMPHPEAFVRWSHHPSWMAMRARGRDKNGANDNSAQPHGLAILRNACQMAREHLNVELRG